MRSAPENFLDDLKQSRHLRLQAAFALTQIIDIILQAETRDLQTSGKLGLERHLEVLRTSHQNLSEGTFRFLILGDMKRGKSTFLNALLGEKLLPSDVNPCTALLTLVKYGLKKQVTIHFNDGTSPDLIDFDTFKENYTINPEESKILEAKQESAFPTVSHAVVEYPLPLLEQGLEFVDTPGLNDTEARNQMVVDYIDNCYGVLFILSAVQPFTLDERRYLNNYLQNRGLTLFFLINHWDRLRTSVVNPNDTVEVEAAENQIRQVFQPQLQEYCQELYPQRVFEISALEALRQQIKARKSNANSIDLEGTGFSEFFRSLNQFLAHDQVKAELQRVIVIGNQVYRQTCEAVERRIPLLDETTQELKERIESVQTEFHTLIEISDRYQSLIRCTRDQQAQKIADSFKTYILKLEDTFEEDFINSQPDLDFLSFLDPENRSAFHRSFRRAFERYLNDRLAAWEFMAKEDLGKAFTQLQDSAKEYQEAYAAAVEAMHEKLIGNRFYAMGTNYKPQDTSVWADSVKDLFEAIPDTLNSSVSRFNYFWQNVLRVALVYFCVYAALSIVGIVFSSLILNVIGVIALGGGVVIAQAEVVRQQFIKATKQEFVKYLPQIAEDQWRSVYEAVENCFDVYEKQIIGRITTDINSRKLELDNLLAQKESYQINRDHEIQRLTALKGDIAREVQKIETLAKHVAS